MKTINRRNFLKGAGVSAAAIAMPITAPAAATLLEAGAGLCLVLAVTAVAVTCVVRLCRPKYILYFSVNEDKPTNGGREYLCLSCSRAEAQQRELQKCEGPFTDLAACQAKAAIGNTNYLLFSCGPVAGDPPLRASITIETTRTPNNPKSWRSTAPAKEMDLNDDDPQVSFSLPRESGSMFFRANASSM